MTPLQQKQTSVLAMSTLAFTVCFAVWTMFAVIGIPLKRQLGLSETEFGLLIAVPVLTGSLIRLPLGMWTDRYGGRPVFFVLMLLAVPPVWLIAHATTYWQLLLAGLMVGLAGGSFPIGIAYCARWFSQHRQGFAMGVFGAGNTGAALTKLVAPAIVVAYDWRMVPHVYAVAMLATAILFWLLTYEDGVRRLASHAPVKEQLAALKDPNVWKLCQYYSIVFGGYVALALWMTEYYVSAYGFGLRTAALLAMAFSLPGGILRAAGGWLSDRWGAHRVTWWVLWLSCACLFVMSYPPSAVTLKTAAGTVTYHLGLDSTPFTILLFVVGTAFAFGKASVFKYIADDYPQNIGVVAGIVGLVGGLSGFLLPILFGVLVDLTGVRTSVFMLMCGVTMVSLLWMFATDIRGKELIQRAPRFEPDPME